MTRGRRTLAGWPPAAGPPPGPYDLGRTLGVLARGPGDPAYRVAADGAVWRASRTPAGPGTVRMAARDGRVLAEAWGPGGDWLLDHLPALLGADDDPAAFVPRHRLLHEAHRRNPGLRLARTGLVLESLVPAVLEQKVTSDEAYRAWRLLLSRHGDPAPGPSSGMPRMRVMPDARAWALIPSWEWHRAGVDGKRSATIVRAGAGGVPPGVRVLPGPRAGPRPCCAPCPASARGRRRRRCSAAMARRTR
ncbi:hypothetical protein GCM10020221_25400 [Streptomyces thioluteus]|uniref:3-methyladenine DNA glycosylase n=1 Tax=Streptomyces thioluteus TaxID=66431 RepID=A0ABN3WXP7_STRTU